jgi:hypothetical protein
MRELLAVDGTDRAELHAVLGLVVGRNHRHGLAAGLAHDLDGHRPEASGAAPHENHVAVLDCVRRPPHEHSVRGRTDQRGRRRVLPAQMRSFREALVRLDLRELRE